MKRYTTRSFIIISIFLSISGCDKLIMGEEPGTSPIELFDQLWLDVDKTYSFFQVKNIDWDSVKTVYRPMVKENTTSSELFNIMASMLNSLRDGHVNLNGLGKGSAYTDWVTSFPVNYYPTVIDDQYLSSVTESSSFKYGDLDNSDLGYVHITHFRGNRSNFEGFLEVLNLFEEKKGLIIDVRNNGGGSTNNSHIVAGYFTDESSVYSYYRYKNGTGHSDFTEWIAQRSIPGSISFSKPVVLLTNRSCFSTTENFILEMQAIPSVTVIGDTTGGGAGNPIWRELPNGWTYRISRWQAVTLQKRQYEGTGLYPDIPVWTTEADSLDGKDAILDRAIESLSNQIK